MFGSLRIDDARFGVVNLFVIFKAINRDRYIIDAINNRERLRKIAFPNVSDQFIFCKNTDGGRAFVFARFQTTVNSDPVAFAIQLRKNTLAAIECYAGHRQRKNAVRSFKFASAGFCFRLRAGFFLLLQARVVRRLRQEDLAAQIQLKGINMERDSISRIEIGTRFVSDFELKIFAEVLGVSVNWLLGIDE